MVVELPSSNAISKDKDKKSKRTTDDDEDEDGDGDGGPDHEAVESQDKLEAISIEYAFIMSAQLDSQRCYYEDEMSIRLDQLSIVTRKWEEALASIELEKKARVVGEKRVSEIERKAEVERREASARLAMANKAVSEEMVARKKEKGELVKAKKETEALLTAEKEITSSLVANLSHLKGEVKKREEETAAMRNEVAELQDQMRDVMFALSARDQIEAQGGASNELAGGDVSVPAVPAPGSARRKKKR